MKISDILTEDLVVTHLEGNSKRDIIDAMIDIVARSPKVLDVEKVRTAIFERDSGEPIPPGVLFGKGPVPEFLRRREGSHFAFRPILHINAVDALAVGGIREPNREFAGVVLGLPQSFRQRLVPSLGLDHGQLRVAILEHIVGRQCLAAPPVAFESSQRDREFATGTASLNNASTRGRECWVDMFSSGFGFVSFPVPMNGV